MSINKRQGNGVGGPPSEGDGGRGQDDRLRAARNVLLSSSPGQFDLVLSAILKLSPDLDLSDDWVAQVRSNAAVAASVSQKRGTGGIFTALRASPVLRSVHDFFHARTGPGGCRLVGYVRVCYAALFLYSRTLMALDLTFLMHPQTGVMPYRAARETLDDDRSYSVFMLAPSNPAVLYATFCLGIVQGVLLLLGVAPRFQAFGVYFFLYNFHNQNHLIWDHQEVMLRLWAFFLMLLPLDHITIYDGFGSRPGHDKANKEATAAALTSSWPMWPFRLWQIYTCLVYAGAGLGKLATDSWRDGRALYDVGYDSGFGRFPLFAPDFLFERMGPVKALTWMTLALECACFVTIWPRATRRCTFLAVVLLHVGIELTMVMHIFQYLSVLGWIVFFVEPNDGKRSNCCKASSTCLEPNNGTAANATTSTVASISIAGTTPRRRRVLDSIVAATLLYLFVVDALPTSTFEWISPLAIRPFIRRCIHKPIKRARQRVLPLMKLTKLKSGEWQLFWELDIANYRYTAVIRFQNEETPPAVWVSPEWIDMTWYERERNLWSDAYYYYLREPEESFPVLITLCEYLARRYSGGAVTYDDGRGRLMIHPSNNVSSVSLVRHMQWGGDPPKDLGWFEPVQRKWFTQSDCVYVLNLPTDRGNNGSNIIYMKMKYAFNDDKKYKKQSGCSKYDRADDAHHSIGSFDSSGDEARIKRKMKQ